MMPKQKNWWNPASEQMLVAPDDGGADEDQQLSVESKYGKNKF